MRRLLLSSACLFALSALTASPASAAAITVDGAYDNYDFTNGLGRMDGYDVNGAVNLSLPWSNLSVEFDIGDDGIGGSHTLDVGGGIVWTDPDFRLAGTVIYNRGSAPGFANLDETTIGAGGEWYFSDLVTVGAHGGAIAGNFAGGFASGAVKVYVMPDLSVEGSATFSDWKVTGFKVVSETDFGAKGEYLVSEDFPLTVQAGYTHVQVSGFGIPFFDARANVFSVGLKLYLDSSSASGTLIQRNRTGTLDTIGPIHPFWFNF
jgi:hypothetical protein